MVTRLACAVIAGLALPVPGGRPGSWRSPRTFHHRGIRFTNGHQRGSFPGAGGGGAGTAVGDCWAWAFGAIPGGGHVGPGWWRMLLVNGGFTTGFVAGGPCAAWGASSALPDTGYTRKKTEALDISRA